MGGLQEFQYYVITFIFCVKISKKIFDENTRTLKKKFHTRFPEKRVYLGSGYLLSSTMIPFEISEECLLVTFFQNYLRKKGENLSIRS